TGYSSLSYLQRLPVARIKIDRSFIANLTSTPSDAAIVRAIVAMAHSLGIGVIAEGVESEGQLGFLRNLRCEEAQGYHVARPMPADEFQAFLRHGHRIPALARADRPGRYVLAVDNEPNILSALRRVLRRTDLQLLTTTSIQEAFGLLASYPVGVVVCDQRIPEMTGTEFLRRVRELYPATVRIVLSGYTDLNAVIGAINRGAIYKFLTKPWEDQVLIDCLQEAFRLFEMERENRALVRRVQELLEAGPAGE
ncbi:MAG: EAL domain-containing protein, partial [Pseudomonas sp.]|nr:EAL domain-containing protein [Pseudomonas sp.]